MSRRARDRARRLVERGAVLEVQFLEEPDLATLGPWPVAWLGWRRGVVQYLWVNDERDHFLDDVAVLEIDDSLVFLDKYGRLAVLAPVREPEHTAVFAAWAELLAAVHGDVEWWPPDVWAWQALGG